MIRNFINKCLLLCFVYSTGTYGTNESCTPLADDDKNVIEAIAYKVSWPSYFGMVLCIKHFKQVQFYKMFPRFFQASFTSNIKRDESTIIVKSNHPRGKALQVLCLKLRWFIKEFLIKRI